MEKRLSIFILISTTVIVSISIANHRLPLWTSWGLAAGTCIRLLVQLFIKKKKSNV
ncbi:MAG: hypothetical protein ABIN01_22605 [Ferruginibacter sp.]